MGQLNLILIQNPALGCQQGWQWSRLYGMFLCVTWGYLTARKWNETINSLHISHQMVTTFSHWYQLELQLKRQWQDERLCIPLLIPWAIQSPKFCGSFKFHHEMFIKWNAHFLPALLITMWAFPQILSLEALPARISLQLLVMGGCCSLHFPPMEAYSYPSSFSSV